MGSSMCGFRDKLVTLSPAYFPEDKKQLSVPSGSAPKKSLCFCFRIAGDTALCKNIHESVSAQIRKNFAKSKWRVSAVFTDCPGPLPLS